MSSEPPKQTGDVTGNITFLLYSTITLYMLVHITVDQLQQYLVAYVNQALSLDPPLPSAGRPFYSTCSQPDIIWYVVATLMPL